MEMATFKSRRISLQNKLISFFSNLLKQEFGKGPENIKVKILEDIVEIDAKGYLVALEKSLLGNKDNIEDIKFVMEIRKRWLRKNKEYIREQISNIIGKEVDFICICKNPIKDTLKVVLIIK